GIGAEREQVLHAPDLADTEVAALGVLLVVRLVANAAGGDELHVGVAAGERVTAVSTPAAGLLRRRAVEGGGELQGHRSLADAFRAGEHPGVRGTRGRERPVQGRQGVRVADDAPHGSIVLREGFRVPVWVGSSVTGSSLDGRLDEL